MRLSLGVLKHKQFKVAFYALVAFVCTTATNAFAQNATNDFTGYATTVGENIYLIPEVINYFAFTSGVILMALGLQELRKHIESPQNMPLRTPLAKLGFGGMLASFPFIAGMIAATMGAVDFDPFKFLVTGEFTFGVAGAGNGGLGALIVNSINNTVILLYVASIAAFIIGLFLTLRGIQMLRAHVENPGQNPLPESLKRLGVGGALLSFPVIVNVVYETFGANGKSIKNSGWAGDEFVGPVQNAGLDGMMVRFIGDIANPAYLGIEAFCFVSGTLMILFAMQRLVKTAQDGARGPLGFGTIVMFIVSGLLLSFPELLSTLNISIFNNGGTASTRSILSLSGADSTQMQNAQNVFSAVLAFMAVIGFLSVVRGLFILKAFADGNGQATMMTVVTHIVAGALAINLGGLINAIQNSLGITDFAVKFS
jgi:hypothetical protein